MALKSTQIDITRQKELENAYNKTESHLFSVLENSKDIILSVDREYNLLSINKAGNEIFKASLNIDVEPGDNIIRLIPPALAENWKRRYDRALSGQRFTEEEYYQDQSGELYFELSIYPVYENDDIIAATVISRDITVRKLHELKLVEGERNYRNLAIEKEQLLQNLRDYTSELSHVLRRPVSNLLAFSDQLQKGYLEQTDLEKSVAMIKKETKALDDIIHELTERLEKSKSQ
ncbi:MAG: PAS domain S-box protein [Bacteroidetes bacterium]|nr:PAS domain S-box protein [Bacteroidota bacterium]